MSNFSHGEKVVPDLCQCHSDRQLIGKKKNQKTKNKPGFWVLVTNNRRRKEQNGKNGRRKKKVNADEEEEEKLKRFVLFISFYVDLPI